ncbi:MAG: glycosyl hydrolase [Bacteroidales bacterium]|nr:glycosyl hydrolase [Bacteroidales bacterium]
MNKKIAAILATAFALSGSCTNLNNDRERNNNRGEHPPVINVEELSSRFMYPPDNCRPGAFWCWLNGNMSKEAITRDLREMSEKGMSRAEIWDVAAAYNPDNFIPAGPAFFSDESVELIKYAISEGEKYGIKIGMVGSSGWNAGGEWVEPDWASKALYYSDTTVKGNSKINISLPFPEVPAHSPKDSNGNPQFKKEVAVLAVPHNAEKKVESKEMVLNLTDHFENGILNCDLPEGEWTIMRFICSNSGQTLIVPSPNSGGLFIDFLDPKATERHLKHFMNRLGFVKGNSSKSKLSYIEFDSMELDEGTVWTDSMPEIFRKMRAYDLTHYLPVFAGWEIGDESDQFLYDWEKTLSDQLIFSHYNTGRRFLEQYGIELVAEAGGPGPPIWNTCPVDALKALGNVSVPRGEFWIRHRNMFLVKEISSASHIYGKKLVDAESFTTWRRWKDSPYTLKKYVDRAFCEGLNCVTFHTFASTNPEDGLPGRTYHAGSDINPGTTWWEKSAPFMDYLTRCSYMLQEGRFVADVCYFYGDQAPNFSPLFHDVPEKPGITGLSKGYDFDVVNSDVILNRMSVEKGRIVLPDGMSYSFLILPDQTHMPLAVLKKLEMMVKAGATIIGKKPINVPGLNKNAEDTQELSSIADLMWRNPDGGEMKINAYGKGRVVSGLTATELLQSDNIEKDFSSTGSNDLDYIHRQFANGDAYFVRNESEVNYSGDCTFRQSGKFPELWDPSSGEQLKVKNFTKENGVITVQLNLPPAASVFVVFTDKERKELQTYVPSETLMEEKLAGPWKVTFPEGWGAPSEISLDKLISWTDSDMDGVKYFSGTATYNKPVNINAELLDEGRRVSIDLGDVRDVAEVYLNGQSAGILWKKPYSLDITDLIRPGENQLKIEIVNMWVNRLTGDMLSDPKDRYCRTNHPYVKKDNRAGGGDETYRIQASGLLGPVQFLFHKDI